MGSSKILKTRKTKILPFHDGGKDRDPYRFGLITEKRLKKNLKV